MTTTVLLTPISPLDLDTDVPTGSHVSFNISSTPSLDFSTFNVSINGVTAYNYSGFVNGFTGPSPSPVSHPPYASSYDFEFIPPDHFPGLTSIVVNTTTLGIPSSYSFTTGVRPKVDSVNPFIGDPFGRNIRVTFDQNMTSDAALLSTANYVLSTVVGDPLPPTIPAIVSVTPEAVVLYPSYVDLWLADPMVNNGQYVLTINNSNIYGSLPSGTPNKLSGSPDNAKTFLGFGTISEGSIYKDTSVNTPIIEGPEYISFAPTHAQLILGGIYYQAKNPGTTGNSLTIWLVDPGVANSPLHVIVTGNATVVYLQTNSSSTIISRISDVTTAILSNTSPLNATPVGDGTATAVPMATAVALIGGASRNTTSLITFVKNSPTNPNLGSLDPDVVSIALGPSSSGVVGITNFINNGNGSGSFVATFSTLVTNYKLSVVVTDNVDNISSESNILSVSVLPDTIPGVELVITPYQSIYTPVCNKLLDDIPQSLFFLKESFTVPYTYDPYPFTLRVVDVGVPIFVTLTRDTFSGKPTSNLYTYIPQSLNEIILLPLGKGRNYVYATDGVRSAQIVVSATTYASVLCSISTEIFNYSRLDLDATSAAIFNDLTTRLAEPYLSLYEVLPSVRPQQILSMKLAIKSYVDFPGQQQAVRDLTTAITLQTPYINPNRSEKVFFEPESFPLFRTQEAFGGSDVHVWLHNTCASRWGAFVKYLSNLPSMFRLIDVSDVEVLYEDQNGVEQRHTFNLLDPACSTLDLGNFCFDNVQIGITSSLESHIKVCAAQYPMDLCFGPLHPLGGHGYFDSGIVWDSGMTWDDDDAYLNPGSSGWEGFCMTPHWDSDTDPLAVPPRHFDPVLGEVIRNASTKVYGIGTHFLSYFKSGNRVYFRNENVAFPIVSVDSDTKLTLGSPSTPTTADYPVNSGISGVIAYVGAGTVCTLSNLGTLGSTDLAAGVRITLFQRDTATTPPLTEPVIAESTGYISTGSCFAKLLSYPPSLSTHVADANWVVGPIGILKHLGGVPLDSMGPTPSDALLGKVYILDSSIPAPNSTYSEVPFYVTGLNTLFTQTLEVGYTVYFPDDPITLYNVDYIVNDNKILISKISPTNPIGGAVIPPHSRVIPTVTSDNDASITPIGDGTIATFVAPYKLFTVSSIGNYINIPNCGVGLSFGYSGLLTTDVPVFVPGDSDRYGLSDPASNVVFDSVYKTIELTSANLISFLPGDVGFTISVSGTYSMGNDGIYTIDAVLSDKKIRVLETINSNGSVSPILVTIYASINTVTLSGTTNVSNSGKWAIVHVNSPYSVNLRRVGPIISETSGFAWRLNVTSPTYRRLGRIVSINGAAPTDSINMISMDSGTWGPVTSPVTPVATNNFRWELLPNPEYLVDKYTPSCVYQNGYATRAAVLSSTDVDLYQQSVYNASYTFTEDSVYKTIDKATKTFTLHNPSDLYFLPGDVGFYITVANSVSGNDGDYTIITVVDPYTVVVSETPVSDESGAGLSFTLHNTPSPH